jgi:TetR/AcrR family transcriptional regulator
MSSYRMKAAALSKITSSRNEGEERIRTRNERQILKAATIVFSRKGFDGTRIAEIAKQAGLPKANVYYYFSSKEDIYAAAIAQLIQGWDDALEHISRDREPIESLEAYVRAKLDYSRRNGEESRMLAAEILRGARFLSRKDRNHMRLVTRRHAEVIEHWIASGKIRAVDPRHLFIMLWSATQFYADFEPLVCDALEVRRLAASDYESAARTIVQTVLRGLQA